MFSADVVGAGLVSHEMTHAALAECLCNRNPDFRNPKADERLATIAGELTRKFWVKWWSLPSYVRRFKRKSVKLKGSRL